MGGVNARAIDDADGRTTVVSLGKTSKHDMRRKVATVMRTSASNENRLKDQAHIRIGGIDDACERERRRTIKKERTNDSQQQRRQREGKDGESVWKNDYRDVREESEKEEEEARGEEEQEDISTLFSKGGDQDLEERRQRQLYIKEQRHWEDNLTLAHRRGTLLFSECKLFLPLPFLLAY